MDLELSGARSVMIVGVRSAFLLVSVVVAGLVAWWQIEE